MSRTYVLVHGAWFGGWVWRAVAPVLRSAGHVVTTPTLTGLGERAHLATPDTSLSTHVADLVAHIETEDLRDVHLVGWSYGGMVVTGAIATIADRVASLVYLDAFVPEHGRALADYSSGQTRRLLAARGDAGGEPLPVRRLETFGVDDPSVLAFCEPRLRPQPVRCMTEPVHIPAGLPDRVARSYLLCTAPRVAGVPRVLRSAARRRSLAHRRDRRHARVHAHRSGGDHGRATRRAVDRLPWNRLQRSGWQVPVQCEVPVGAKLELWNS